MKTIKHLKLKEEDKVMDLAKESIAESNNIAAIDPIIKLFGINQQEVDTIYEKNMKKESQKKKKKDFLKKHPYFKGNVYFNFNYEIPQLAKESIVIYDPEQLNNLIDKNKALKILELELNEVLKKNEGIDLYYTQFIDKIKERLKAK